MRIRAEGISVELPQNWEGTIFRRALESASALLAAEQFPPVTHLGNFALPPLRGDFGSGAVDVMRADNIFVAIVEYGPECAGTALFKEPSLPRFTPASFNPSGLQRIIPGQSGTQAWCTIEGRAFGVYAVLGAHSRASTLVPQVNRVLAATTIEPR